MVIKILGAGCKKCNKLENNTKLAVEELGINVSIKKVTDFKEIMKYRVMQTPVLVVDEKVKVVAKIPSVEEIKKILTT